MRKIIQVSLGSLALYALPLVAFAQTPAQIAAKANDPFGYFLRNDVTVWVQMLVGIVFVLAVVVFFWGLVKYLTAVGEEKHNGLLIMFYGVLVIFVMVALWGLVNFFGNTLLGQGKIDAANNSNIMKFQNPDTKGLNTPQ